MKFVIHHFRKEFRYLRFRWLGYLALLLFEMAVYLEWLVPIRPGVPSPDWIGFLPALVLVSGLSLLISCPEDRPGSDRSFISTRPMPLRAYWLSRLLVWMLLIILPALVQNALYLFLSDRPFGEILQKTGERFVSVAGYTAALIPALALWRRNEIWKAVLILVPSLFLVSKLLNYLIYEFGTAGYFYPHSMQLTALGWGLFALLTGAVVWRHLDQALSFRKRILLTIFAGVLGLCFSRIDSFGDPLPDPKNLELVHELAPDLEVDFDLEEANFEGTKRDFGPSFRGHAPEVSNGPGVHVTLHSQKSHFYQNGKTLVAETEEKHSYRGWYSPAEEVHRGDMVLSEFFPKDTLFLPFNENMPRWSMNEQALTNLATFSDEHPDFEEPVVIETDFLVDWFQRDLAMEIPLREDATADTDGLRWKLLRISPAEGPDPGNLTIYLHRETRNFKDRGTGHTVLLHLADQQIVRLEPAQQKVYSARAAKTGWMRSQVELTWNHVFNHADGEPTGVDLSQAKLILLRSRFLGRSEASWKSPEFRLADLPSTWGDELSWNQERALYQGREKKAFLERVETLTPPTESSSPEEARRYAYDVFQAASVTNAVYKQWIHKDIAESFKPLGEHHLPTLLALRAHIWPGWTNRPPNSLLKNYVTDEQKDVLVERALENARVADIVVEKDWSEAAKELHSEQIYGAPALDDAKRTLLLDWIDDPAAANRLLEHAPHDFHGYITQELAKNPETRDEVAAIVEEEFEDTLFLLSSLRAGRKVQRAADFGSERAFALCLRWLSLDGDIPRAYPPYPTILETDGSDFWRSKRVPSHERRSFFRKLKVSDFTYMPEERAWKFKQP